MYSSFYEVINSGIEEDFYYDDDKIILRRPIEFLTYFSYYI